MKTAMQKILPVFEEDRAPHAFRPKQVDWATTEWNWNYEKELSIDNLPLMTGLSQPVGGIIGLSRNGHSTGGGWTGGDFKGGNGLINLTHLVEGQQPGKYTTMGDSTWGEGGPLSGQITALILYYFCLFLFHIY